MLIRNGPTVSELEAMVIVVSHAHYSDNLTIKAISDESTSRATVVRFTLRVRNSSGPGAHWSAGSGRRTVAACWHAHRDVLRRIFAHYPDARITTAFATYDGVSGFNRTFPGTYDHNAGSMMYPVCYGDLCLCEDNDDMSEETLGVTYPVMERTLSPEDGPHYCQHRYNPHDPRYDNAEQELESWRDFMDSLPKKVKR